MKDELARNQIKGLQSRGDKTKSVLMEEIRAVHSKLDKRTLDLIQRVEHLESRMGTGWDLREQIDDFWRRFLNIEEAWLSKFRKTDAYWQERK